MSSDQVQAPSVTSSSPQDASRPARAVHVAVVLTLPSDVFLYMFDYLSTQDLLCSVAQTCTSWHDLLLSCAARQQTGQTAPGRAPSDRKTERNNNNNSRTRPIRPSRAAQHRLGEISQHLWRTRWQHDLSTRGCRLLHTVLTDPSQSRQWKASEAPADTPRPPLPLREPTTTTMKTTCTEPQAAVARLAVPFMASPHAPLAPDHLSPAPPAAATLQLRLRPLILTPPTPHASGAGHGADAFKSQWTAQLLANVEQLCVARVLAASTAAANPLADAPPCDRLVSRLAAEAKEETALLCRKALYFFAQRDARQDEVNGSVAGALPSSPRPAAVVDSMGIFETITFSTETYPPTKLYANEEGLLIDATRLCATLQYAVDCAYHQNFVAPHTLTCLRGEVGDTTTIDTPEEPVAEDIDGRRHHASRQPALSAATDDNTATQQTGGWVAATGGSPLGPDLLMVNVLWTPQRKTELYSAVMEGIVDPPRGLGAFFPIALTPDALTLYEARRAAVLAHQHVQVIAEATAAAAAADEESLPIPAHFPTPMSAPGAEPSLSPPEASTAAAAAPPLPLADYGAGQLWLESAPQVVTAPVPTAGERAATMTSPTTPPPPPPPSTGLPSSPPLLSTPMPFLFPSEHLLPYLYLLEHLSFTDVKHHFWQPDEHKYAICSRLVSPTADSVECRFFYSYYIGSFPRLHMKMVFTQGDLPRTLMNRKLESPQAPMPPRRRRQRPAERHAAVPGAPSHSASSEESSDVSELSSSLTTSSGASSTDSPVRADARANRTARQTASAEPVVRAASISFVEEGDAPFVSMSSDMPQPQSVQFVVPTVPRHILSASSHPAAVSSSSSSPSFCASSSNSDISFHEEEPTVDERANEASQEPNAPHTHETGGGKSDADDDDDDDVLPRHDPDEFNTMHTLFVGGYGRVEVDVTPTVYKESFLALRAALGLPETFPISWLWNVVVCASGLGARMMHRHLSGFLYPYHRTFTDAMEAAFGGTACYGELYPWLRAAVNPQETTASATDDVPSALNAGGDVDSTASDSPPRAARSFSTSEAPTSTTTFDHLDEPSSGTRGHFRGPFGQRPTFFDSDDDSSEFDFGVSRGSDFLNADNESGMWSDASGGS